MPTLSISTANDIDASTAASFLKDGFGRVDEVIDPDELKSLRRMYDWCFSDDAKNMVNQKALGALMHKAASPCRR